MRTIMRIRVILSIVISILIEVVFFNFAACVAQVQGVTPVIIENEQFSRLNWEEDAEQLVSLPDPILYVEGLNIAVQSMILELDADPMPSTCTLFYTTEHDEAFSAEKMIVLEMDSDTGRSIVNLSLTDPLLALRIDPGEDAGLVLNYVSVRINDFAWDISAARIVAMMVIYWSLVGLMRLQKSPDYGIHNKNEEEKVNVS